MTCDKHQRPVPRPPCLRRTVRGHRADRFPETPSPVQGFHRPCRWSTTIPAYAADVAHRLQQLGRPHDIDVESLDRPAESLADQRLCREMKDDLRLMISAGIGQFRQIANIGARVVVELSAKPNRLKKEGVVGGASEYPITLAPSSARVTVSHPPMNPVWPVTNTHLPRQKLVLMLIRCRFGAGTAFRVCTICVQRSSCAIAGNLIW